MTLDQYINQHYKSKLEFAKAQGVKVPQVYQWIAKGFIVECGVLYSPRRELIEVGL